MRNTLLAVLCLVSVSALAADIIVGSPMAPDNPLAPFAEWLGGPTALKLLAWMGACRAIGKLVSGKLQELLEAFRVWAKGTATTNDDHILDRLLNNPAYRGLSFLVDYFFSIKLPQGASGQPAQPAPQPAPSLPLVQAMAALALICLTGCMGGPRERRDNITPATIVEGDMRTGKFRFEGPKNTEARGILIEHNTNGITRVEIKSINTVVDPNVVGQSYSGEVERINADGARLEKVINATGTAVGSGIGAAAKTAIKP